MSFLKIKIEAYPVEFKKARKKLSWLFKIAGTEEGKKFLAMQGSERLKELIKACQDSLSLAESHEFWEFVDKTAEKVRKEIPDWAKGGKSTRKQ